MVRKVNWFLRRSAFLSKHILLFRSWPCVIIFIFFGEILCTLIDSALRDLLSKLWLVIRLRCIWSLPLAEVAELEV